MTEHAYKDREAEEMRAWPSALVRLVALIGKEKTIELASTYGGLDRIHIPRASYSTSHMWRNVLADDEWRRVVDAMGGERVDLPRGVFLCVKKWLIIDLAQENLTHRQIAVRAQCTERYIRLVLQGHPKPVDNRQQKLFE